MMFHSKRILLSLSSLLLVVTVATSARDASLGERESSLFGWSSQLFASQSTGDSMMNLRQLSLVAQWAGDGDDDGVGGAADATDDDAAAGAGSSASATGHVLSASAVPSADDDDSNSTDSIYTDGTDDLILVPEPFVVSDINETGHNKTGVILPAEQEQPSSWPLIVITIFLLVAVVLCMITAVKNLKKRKGYQEIKTDLVV